MTATQTCHGCTREVKDGYACTTCASQAKQDLWHIGYLLGHVDAKRAKIGSKNFVGPSSPSAETPVPFDPRVTKVMIPLRQALLGSAEIIREARGVEPDMRDWRRLAFWVGAHVNLLRTMQEGPEEFDTYGRLRKSLDAVFDRPPDTLYLGQCGADLGEDACPAYVYVERDDTGRSLPAHASCPDCNAQVDVGERREYFLDAVSLYQATMRELVQLAPLFLENPVSHRTLKEWTRQGILKVEGHRQERDWEGRWQKRPAYLIGALVDAQNVWEARKVERSKKARKRSA